MSRRIYTSARRSLVRRSSAERRRAPVLHGVDDVMSPDALTAGRTRGTRDDGRTSRSPRSWHDVAGGPRHRGTRPSSAYPAAVPPRNGTASRQLRATKEIGASRASEGSHRREGGNGRFATCRTRCDRKTTPDNFPAKMYQLHTHQNKRGTLSWCAVSSRAVVGPVPHVTGRHGCTGESSQRGGPKTHFLDLKCTTSKRSLFLEHRWGGCGL